MRLPPVGASLPTGLPTFEEPRDGPPQAEHDSPEPPANPYMQPQGPSFAERLVAFRNRVANLARNQVDWTAQLLALVTYIETTQDVQDWFDALTPGLCKACPDLLLRLSDRLRHLLPQQSFTPEDVRICATLCLDAAWKAGLDDPVWIDLCTGIRHLRPAAIQALLSCLRAQRDRWESQLPSDRDMLIRHVKAVRHRMIRLAERGYGVAPCITPIAHTDAAPVKLEINEIIAIDTNPQRYTNAYLSSDALMLVLAHLLKNLGIDWMRPQRLAPRGGDRQVLRDLALLGKQFHARFGPLHAQHTWMVAEARIRLNLDLLKQHELDALITQLIHELVDLKAPRVASMLPCAPGVAHRRLDLMLRALMISLNRVVPGREGPWLTHAYLQLHDWAVLQLASRSQGMSPCFAEHIDLSVLPFRMLDLVDRMLGFEGTNFSLLVSTVLKLLPAYPEDVQAQTLINLLTLSDDEETNDMARARLGKLMHESDSWSNAAPPAWLRYQWMHLDSVTALVDSPRNTHVPDGLLAALRQHHGVGDRPALLIDDPFDERYVLWTVADIRVLAAMCQHPQADEGEQPELVSCVADLLRQLCAISAGTYKFVDSTFMGAFPMGILRSAFLRLTTQEQGAMLVRTYAPDDQQNWSDHMELIELFATNKRIDRRERKLVLAMIQRMPKQDMKCVTLARKLMGRLT